MVKELVSCGYRLRELVKMFRNSDETFTRNMSGSTRVDLVRSESGSGIACCSRNRTGFIY